MVVLFCLAIGFNFTTDPSISAILEIACIVCVYTAIAIPTLAGFVSLFLKLKAAIQQFAKRKYALKAYHEAVMPRNAYSPDTLAASQERELPIAVITTRQPTRINPLT